MAEDRGKRLGAHLRDLGARGGFPSADKNRQRADLLGRGKVRELTPPVEAPDASHANDFWKLSQSRASAVKENKTI